jgi:SnoaL-like domain
MTIRDTLERFVAGFNVNSLDDVMAFFADDAVYRSPDGVEHRGRDAIRAAFAPQFGGRFGAMTFAVDDWIVDETARKAAIRWACRHDFATAPAPARWLFRVMYGARAGWRGMDVFHFASDGRIAAKYSYLTARRPTVRRELGG